ncbi:MAG TPA: T9SS type A sorting domain-containing protein [Chitinophagaceae bacterium]|nr:T9SS type A sorting domain-containing protein [Chitinophagaceae bacterium]
MKKYLLLYKILFLSITGHAQLTIAPGANWVNSGNITVSLQNMDFVNDGAFIAGSSSMKFTGNQNSNIGGTSLPFFNILEIAKTNSAKVLLTKNSSVGLSINFISGELDLNNNNILLNSSAFIAGESEDNRITGSNGGFVEITQDMNAPASVNAGNLGATISSSGDLGSVTIRRGHLPQSGTGLANSLHRYYLITPANNTNLNSTLRLRYFDAELNGQDENSLVIYQSNNSGTDWNNLSQTIRNTNANYVEKTSLASLALQTFANDNVQLPDGVTGLVFTGQRKKPAEVTVKWTSQTETHMSGYQIQRRLKNEIDFSDRAFVNSLAPGGNSTSELSYQNIDANPYADTSYYRLKILTNNATFTYSNVIAVPGKTKGGGGGNGNGNNITTDDMTTVNGKPMMQTGSLIQKITVGPNPNNGNFWFSINGIEKETAATLYTIDGKQIRQFRSVNLRQQQVNNLRSGIYLLKVPGFETQKIIVNSGGNSAPASKQATDNNSKY